MNCMWCDSTEAKESLNTVYWELPDGTKAIEIKRHHAFLVPHVVWTINQIKQ